MTSTFLLDSHKLMYHPERVASWLAGEDIYPINIEAGPVNRCNYRCSFCAFDYTGYKGDFLDPDIFCRTLKEFAAIGVKSIVYAGTGEPLLHRNLPDFVSLAASLGIDVGLSTNAALFTPELIRKILPGLTWMRISFNAGTQEEYAKIHGCPPANYIRALENIHQCVAFKRANNLAITIGVQSLMLGENMANLLPLGRTLKKIGVDYFTLKPFSRHPASQCERLEDPSPPLEPSWVAEMEALTDQNFHVIIRTTAMELLQNGKKNYGKCLGLSFFSYIEADGKVYACNSFVGDTRYVYGSLAESSMTEIWKSEQRRTVLLDLAISGAAQCRLACRLDPVNQYLWRLKNPPMHVNFI
ncbi:MAG: radical SAM protein [Thermodesulfobacteriota bacterium]